MCEGEGRHLLNRATKEVSRVKTNPRVDRMLEETAVTWLTTTDVGLWKMSLCQLCVACTQAEVNALLDQVLNRKDGDGAPTVVPRLKRIGSRHDKGWDIIAGRQFASGRRLHQFWMEHRRWPIATMKCRIPEANIMRMAIWLHDICSLGWCPGRTRSRVVGNQVIKFPCGCIHMCVCVCVYIYIYICVCVYIYKHIHINVFVFSPRPLSLLFVIPPPS